MDSNGLYILRLCLPDGRSEVRLYTDKKGMEHLIHDAKAILAMTYEQVVVATLTGSTMADYDG